ncbi:IS3 family transposase [Mammaliicoccus sciuri]
MIDYIEQGKENHPVQVFCEVLEVPKSTHYQSFHNVKASYEIENETILARIKIICAESEDHYGTPKIHQFLKKEVFTVSLKREQRLIK